MVRVLLPFINIFAGIFVLLLIALSWAKFDTWFHKKLKYDMKKIFYILSAAAFILEIIVVIAIHYIYHFQMVNVLFIFDGLLLFLVFAIPYHAQPILNAENVHNRNYIDRSDQLDVQVSHVNQSPFFIASLAFIFITIPVIVVYCLG
jgi:hypothetical protein